MSNESDDKKSDTNVILITLSDDDDDDADEVKIVDEKGNIFIVKEEVEVVYEKNQACSIIKTVNLHTIDDTKSDVSFGTDSSIDAPVKFNKTNEPVEIEIIEEEPKPLDTPVKKENTDKINDAKLLDVHERIKEEKTDSTRSQGTTGKVKTEIKEETKTKIKEEIKTDRFCKIADDSKENLINLKKIKPDPDIKTKKRKEFDDDDHKHAPLQEIKLENVKIEQKFNYRSNSNDVINKKFKNDNNQPEEQPKMKAETSSVINEGNTSRQSKSSRKRLNIMFTGINSGEFEKSLSTIGGTLVNNPSIAEVFVTDQLRRKFKFSLAVARGIPIVSIEWVKTSIDNNKFQDPFLFIIKDIRFERDFNVDLRDSLIKSQKKPIFDDYAFIITRNVSPKFSDLSELIRASGGVALLNAPKIWKEHTFIVSCETDLPVARKKKINSPKKSIVPIVEVSFIIDSIWKQRLNIQEHLLCY